MTTRLRARLARRPCRGRTDPGPGSLLGVEHEYSLSDDAGPVDFRPLIHRLPIAGRRVDPGDANAYRCAFGGAMTCDGPEAEVASPPVPGTPGFTRLVDGWARTARAELERILPPGVRADGYSTHLNAALPTPRADRVARRYACTFGPALMLLLDRRDSPGLLVRPRPGRLELGGEYVTGAWLRAATAFAAGSTRAAAEHRFPPRLDVVVEAGVERYGWFVDRRAFGTDLYLEGRVTRLRRRRGGTVTAQEHLDASWEAARGALEGVADAADLRDADRVVAGDLPLPLESDERIEDVLASVALDATAAEVLVPRERPRYTVHAEIATWDFSVFALRGRARTGYLCIPRDWLGDFYGELDAGDLDPEIDAFLDSSPAGRVLASSEQTADPGLYDEVGPPFGLLPRERDPFTGRLVGGGGATGDRPGKRDAHRGPRPRGRGVLAAAAAAILLVLVLAGVAVAVAVGGGGAGDGAEAEGTSGTRAAGGEGGAPRAGADFQPSGTTSASIAYTQDAIYQITQAIDVSPAMVRPGDSVRVATSTTSVGPNWAGPPGGELALSCDATAESGFNRASSSTLYLSPASPSAAVVAAMSEGGAPPGAIAARVQLAGGEFNSAPQGCDRAAESDDTASLAVPLTIRPGRYALVPAWGLYAEFPGQRDQLVHTGGSYPVLTVVRP